MFIVFVIITVSCLCLRELPGRPRAHSSGPRGPDLGAGRAWFWGEGVLQVQRSDLRTRRWAGFSSCFSLFPLVPCSVIWIIVLQICTEQKGFNQWYFETHQKQVVVLWFMKKLSSIQSWFCSSWDQTVEISSSGFTNLSLLPHDSTIVFCHRTPAVTSEALLLWCNSFLNWMQWKFDWSELGQVATSFRLI